MVSVLLKEKNLLFLHVPKTAGGSISRLLRLKADAVLYPVSDMTIAEPCVVQLAKQLDRPLKTFRSIAFVRNPWDWAVSGYIHVTKNRPAFVNPPSFREFVRGEWENPSILQYPHKFNTPAAYVAYHTEITQWAHLFSSETELSLDAICRFERLEEEVKRVFGQDAVLPHANRSDRDHYSKYYDDETRALVASRNVNLIERFGYEF